MKIIEPINKCFYIIILFLSSSTVCSSYEILVVFPMLGNSHKTLGKSCVQLLLEAGHQVTYITWGPGFMESHQNLTVIDVNLPIQLETRYNIEQNMNGEVNLNDVHEFSMIMSLIQRKILENQKIQELLSDPNKNFDVAILEWLYGEYIVGLPAVFGCPYIWLSSMEPHSMILGLIGVTTNPAYTVMNCFHTIPPFNFLERVWSLKNQLSIYLYKEFYIQRIEEKEYEKVVVPLIKKRRDVVPSYYEVRYNASLVLGNSHISVGRSIQLPMAYKDVGGFHVQKNKEPLPKDLKEVMDNSTNGVIYFSMGSTLRSKDLPIEFVQKLLKVFGGLKQSVLWKFEEDLADRPSNVHIVSWAPQESILAHPNCILFISQGGQLSTLEAVNYGIPLIGIPVFVDQHANVKTLARAGMAREVDIYKMDTDLKEAIEDMLTNFSYAEAAKHQSFIYHHRPVPADKELVFWVEHVIRTKGAAHLRSVTFMVPWYQKCYLDIFLLLTVIVSLLTLAFKRLLLWIKADKSKKDYMKKVQ